MVDHRPLFLLPVLRRSKFLPIHTFVVASRKALPMRLSLKAFLPIVCLCLTASHLDGGDWSRFRGPNGNGVSPDPQETPATWNEKENLKWKLELAGPGSSSPIVVGNKVLVTCWSGYGIDQRNPGDQKKLMRHLVCVDRESGKQLWSKSVEPYLPEDRYSGMFAENGYCSHTPVSDGEKVFVFFGKSGVHAFDLDGNKLWEKSVGTESDPRNWGSASSPVLYKNMVIVTASAESESMVALNKNTGEVVWRQEASGFSGTWGTPILVPVNETRIDLVLAVPYEIWGFNPNNGKLRWYCDGIQSNSMCSSVVTHDGIVYAVESGPSGGGAIAVKVGGKGDVTDTHVVWKTRDRSRIGTPIFADGYLHFVSSKVATCIDAKDGKHVFQSRLQSGDSATEVAGDRGSRSRFGRRGGSGGQDYASLAAANGKIYFTTRSGDVYVYTLSSKFNQLAKNSFASDGGDFSATPAFSNGQIFVRSSKYLYCIAKTE